MTDRTMLQFDYEEAHGRAVTAVLGSTDEQAGWASVAVIIGDDALLLEADPDTDEISVRLGTAPMEGNGWKPVAALGHAVGSSLGWCWVGRNYRGYLDMFTLSFDGLEPQVCFVAEASRLTIRAISPLV
jgi:hypothetical protein